MNKLFLQEELYFYLPENTGRGIRKIAEKVAGDIENITGKRPGIHSSQTACPQAIIVLEGNGSREFVKISRRIPIPSELFARRESYFFTLAEKPLEGIERALVICGSDRLGTIYGLFRISELLGVPPLVYFGDFHYTKRDALFFCDGREFCRESSKEAEDRALYAPPFLSREPSVKYRGFFINDEWPCFGNWTFSHFGGFTAEMYDHIFEYLLRMKGNYLWPAMWTSSFMEDGPGLLNLQLADEYGIYIGMSHHEQCMRAGEEYSHVRGADSIYGDAWDYRINPDGLLRFWEDGIRRSRDYRVMPTLGMRGERDSKMLEEGAPLSENVRLLKEIIQKQREMIKIHMEERGPVTKVFAVYKEVEEYYFGGKKGEGLAGDPGLEDVILLFCEDNFGNMRALPSAEDLKKHRGGFGMYYHLDYHGDPISYEWVASQPPIKIWDQMNKAWDHGIRDLWIVNAGDVKFQEYPLSFFMAFAYDREQFRESRCVEEHAENFVRDAFGRHQDASVHSSIKRVLTESLRLNFLRRPEALHSEILHPAHYGETDRMLSLCGSLEEENEAILQRLREEETEKTYYSTVYFPAAASLNLWKMHLFAGKNHLYASQGKAAANHYAGLVEACIERDRALSEDWRRFLGGKWSGMELASHIGFINWNDEDWRYPVRHVLSLPDRERLIVSKAGETKHFSNQYFPRPLVVRDFSESSRKEARIQIAAGGSRKIRWSLTDEKGETPFCPWLSFSVLSGETDAEDILILSVKTAREGNGEATKEVEKKLWRAFRFFIRSGNQSVPLWVEPPSFCLPCEEPGLYVEEDGTIRMDADGYLRKEEGECLGTCYRWEEIPRLGKQRMALRLHPSRGHFLSEKGEKAPLAGAPCLSYGFWLEKEGGYTVIFTLAAANPARYGGKLSLWVVAGQEEKRVDITGRDYRAGEAGCGQWAEAVLKQELTAGEVFFLEKGANRLRVIPSEAGVILERITVCPVGKNPPSSYLGGPESVRIPGWK